MDAVTQQAPGGEQQQQKLKIDKFADGPITCLKFIGTIDEAFDGKKVASTLKGGIVVLDLADVVKISSFGIREWVDFIGKVGQQVDEIYLVECAPKIVDQLNMVANFAGKGRVFSFYAPYRCDYCDADRRVLLTFDRDYEAIKGMKPPERPCQGCGNPEYFDEDPTSFFSYLAAQPKFELDATVAGFLAAKLNYAVSDAARRLRAEKFIEDRNTFIKISGELDGTFPREKLAEGLEGTIVLDVSAVGKIDPAGAAEFRGFMDMITPTTDGIWLHGCPPVFVERLTRAEDLGSKARVISFAMPYSCAKCATTASQLIDVEEHFDVLKFATPPDMKCHDCGGPTTCAAAESLLSHLPTLPRPEVPGELRKFIKLALERKPEKQQMSTTVAEAAARAGRAGWVTTLVSLAGAAVIAAGIVVGLKWYEQKQDEKRVRARDAVGALKSKSADARPEWIPAELADKRFASVCMDMGGTLACTGVSSYSDTQDDARTEATEAALEEATNALSLKIGDPTFRQHVVSLFSESRSVAFARFDAARTDPDGAAYDQARRVLREGRKNVSAALRRSGGSAVPTQPAGEYWEEYAAVLGDGSKFLVYVQVKLSPDAIKNLVARYSTPEEALGGKAFTVFPGVAWRYSDISEGAYLVALGEGPLKAVGLAPQYIVLSVRDRKVSDAADYASKITEEYEQLKRSGGNMKFVVKTGDGPPIEFNRPIPKDAVAVPIRPSGGGTRPSGGGFSVTPWDRTGGGGGNRDDPDE